MMEGPLVVELWNVILIFIAISVVTLVTVRGSEEKVCGEMVVDKYVLVGVVPNDVLVCVVPKVCWWVWFPMMG